MLDALQHSSRLATVLVSLLFWTAAAGGANAQSYEELEARVAQLEQQIVDLQVVIGTLETLARSGGGAPAPTVSAGFGAPTGGGLSGNDAARLSVIETQILAMSGQLQRLEQQLGGSGAAPVDAFSGSTVGTSGGFATEVAPSSGFGDVTVETGSASSDSSFGDGVSFNATSEPFSTASLGTTAADPHEAYKVAYGHLLQQDYGAAESAFRSFLDQYGDHELAGNAQFWLGESLYVRGDYRQAATAFLDGYSADRQGTKAAESLLKLAMSLSRLELKQDACATFAEFSQQFGNASGQLIRRAENEKRRAGC